MRRVATAPTTQQEAYAAAANRLLWRLGLLEGGAGGAPPADPHDNDLCTQLSALMKGLELPDEAPALVHFPIPLGRFPLTHP